MATEGTQEAFLDPLLPVLKEANQSPGCGLRGPRVRGPQSHCGGWSGTAWPVSEGHPPSSPGLSGALGLGPEQRQASLATSALKAVGRSWGGHPTEAPFLQACQTHSYIARAPHSN